MFERFTERARKVIVLAQDEARSMEHNYIGTEHLLLGILREDEGVTAHALNSLNVKESKVREQVESMVGRGEGGTGGQPPFTPRSKKVLELALREAVQLGHNYVGTEHILLGLMRGTEGIAARVLSHLIADPNKVRREVLRVLDGGRGRAARNARGASPPRVAHGAVDAIRREAVRNAHGANPSRATTFRARVEGLVVQARCGATDEERAEPQPLRVDLDYLYEAAGEGDDLSGTVDYGMVIEEAAGLLEREEFRLLETGARKVGESVLAGFPAVQEGIVTVTKLRVPIDREVSGVSVEATFYR